MSDGGREVSTRKHRKGRQLAAFVVAGALLVSGLAVVLTRVRHSSVKPLCTATAASPSYRLDPSQAANAATITAVGKRAGLPDHAVTIALAAALQESQLRNLDHGDRDSVGLFQQRPSQGWGTSLQLINPRYAASAFYHGLSGVPGWMTMSVTDAAQRVQHSGAPDAYALWEPEARALARILTGEVPAGLVCRFDVPAGVTATSPLGTAVASELGSPALGSASLTPARGWTVASWLVGHAYAYRITAVGFAGRLWTPSSGTWQYRSAAAQGQVYVRRAA
jgi:hypothetical protein